MGCALPSAGSGLLQTLPLASVGGPTPGREISGPAPALVNPAHRPPWTLSRLNVSKASAHCSPCIPTTTHLCQGQAGAKSHCAIMGPSDVQVDYRGPFGTSSWQQLRGWSTLPRSSPLSSAYTPPARVPFRRGTTIRQLPRASQRGRSRHTGKRQLQCRCLCSLGRTGLPMV